MATYNLKVYLSNGEEVDNIFTIPEVSATGESGTYISYIEREYCVSDSQTQIPTEWTSTFTPEEGKYVWVRDGVVLTDGTIAYAYSVALIGIAGEKGDSGTDGVWINEINFEEV